MVMLRRSANLTTLFFLDKLRLNRQPRPPDKSVYSKTCLKQPLKKKTKTGFQDRLSLTAGQEYYRMLQGEHSAILSTFIKLPFVINVFVLSIFEWLFYIGLLYFCFEYQYVNHCHSSMSITVTQVLYFILCPS